MDFLKVSFFVFLCQELSPSDASIFLLDGWIFLDLAAAHMVSCENFSVSEKNNKHSERLQWNLSIVDTLETAKVSFDISEVSSN